MQEICIHSCEPVLYFCFTLHIHQTRQTVIPDWCALRAGAGRLRFQGGIMMSLGHQAKHAIGEKSVEDCMELLFGFNQ
jgi:hypothetical protein